MIKIKHILRIGVLGLALLGLLAGALRPSQALAASLPASTCTLNGTTRTCDLWAKTGSLTLPDGTTVTIWGYADSQAGAATLPGPALIANQGETLVVNLHNTLTVSSSLSFPGQTVAPDLIGVLPGAIKAYTITAIAPGTFLYEAGLTPTDGRQTAGASGARQVAMGLYGALIVRPTSGVNQAYGAASSFNEEALVLMSEIDPRLNADPTGFALPKFSPKYYLINGKAFPETAPISVAAGNTLLVRYLNAGIQHRSIGLLGLRQTLVGEDGAALTYPDTVVAQTLPAGETLDALVTIPAGATVGTRYPLFNTSFRGAAASSWKNGMLTFLQVGTGTAPGPDTTGPKISSAQAAPAISNGTGSITIQTTATDASTGGASVTAVEYSVDTAAAAGSGIAISGFAPATAVTANATISASGLANGKHTVYFRAKDSLGNWGGLGSATFTVDKAGPTTSAVVLNPAASRGNSAVSIQASASDAEGSNVVSATYQIDSQPVVALSLNLTAPSVALNGTIAAATVSALSEGVHVVTLQSWDAAGNPGTPVAATLKIDRSAPQAGNAAIAPNPNNGTLSVSSSSAGVRVSATITDPVSAGLSSNVTRAEAFIDTVGAQGAGLNLLPLDGSFNSSVESAYGLFPMTSVQNLTHGNHTVYVRGQDAVGNWGTATTTTLTIDKVKPAVSSVVAQSTVVTSSLAITLTASDPLSQNIASNIVALEYYFDTDPGTGAATSLAVATPSTSINLTSVFNAITLANGNHTIGVRAKDAAGNWSVARTATFSVSRLFTSSFNGVAASPFGWTSATNATQGRLSLNAAANMDGVGSGLVATIISNGTSGYLSHSLPTNPAVSTYRASFYVNPNGVVLGSNTPTIFAARSSSGTIFQVQLQKVGTQYQVRATGSTATAWVNISGPTAIEVYRLGTTLTLYVGGASQGTVTVASTSIASERLGLSAGVVSGMSGSVYFDGFTSARN